MSELVSRIHRLTQELLELNTRLEQDLATFSVDRSSELFQQYALLKAYKGVLDHSRHLIWPYVLGAEQNAQRNAKHVMQDYRMERIRQMVTALKQTDDRSPATQLFLSELRRLTDEAAQRPN